MLEQLNELAKNYEYLIKAIAAFLPFLIAIFMAYIAYQQWQALFLFGKDMQNHIVELFEHKISSHDEFTKPFQKYLVIEKH